MAEGRIVRDTHPPRTGYVPQKLALDAGFPLTVAEFLAVNHPGPRSWFGGVPKTEVLLLCLGYGWKLVRASPTAG